MKKKKHKKKSKPSQKLPQIEEVELKPANEPNTSSPWDSAGIAGIVALTAIAYYYGWLEKEVVTENRLIPVASASPVSHSGIFGTRPYLPAVVESPLASTGLATLHAQCDLDELRNIPIDFDNFVIEGSVHDYPVVVLKDQPVECERTGHYSDGLVCNIGDDVYYMKEHLHGFTDSSEASSARDYEGLVNYEEFMRQFASKNVGAKTVATTFFRYSDTIYIGSKKIENLKFSSADSPVSNEELGPNGVSRLLVSSLWFSDLNNNNWGYTDEEGLILIDLDDATNRPESGVTRFIENEYYNNIGSNMARTFLEEDNVIMTVNDILGMKNILEEMGEKELPKFADTFYMTSATYQRLLDIFNTAHEVSVTSFREHYPELQPDTRLSQGQKRDFIKMFSENCSRIMKELEATQNTAAPGKPRA